MDLWLKPPPKGGTTNCAISKHASLLQRRAP